MLGGDLVGLCLVLATLSNLLMGYWVWGPLGGGLGVIWGTGKGFWGGLCLTLAALSHLIMGSGGHWERIWSHWEGLGGGLGALEGCWKQLEKELGRH